MLLLYFIVTGISGVGLIVFEHISSVSLPVYIGRDLSIFCIILIGSLVEELIFRLPLRRNIYTIFIFLLTIIFTISSKILCGTIYNWDSFIVRIGISLGLAFILCKWILKEINKLRFIYLFYLLSFLFAIAHIFNYALSVVSFTMLFYLILYTFNKFIIGMILGYARMIHGFFLALILHMLNNFLPILIFDYILN